MNLGEKIRNLRKSKKMSIEQLSKISGLSMGLISQMERNITTPSVWSLWEVAKALDVRINYFFDEYDKSLPIVKKIAGKL
ncbi:helix-turn-helix domain-containing protein [uncultured Clostridium sp.]|uniref:helix-turn-helix domain-containing protein n=1 Tax=uncultured Clostridium sp. TaxID=59620 RepID=UPI0025CD70D0|nr:helix-turn-helix transcriptional regulator [uncultured Clostridium sp.]